MGGSEKAWDRNRRILMNVYVNNHVEQVIALHKRTIDQYLNFKSVNEFLDQLAGNLFKAFKKEDPRSVIEITNNYLFIGQTPESIFKLQFTLDDAKNTIAKEYGFDEWVKVPSLAIDHLFEKAVNLLVNGELSALEKIIDKNPELVSKRSNFGHQATLLHYAGSNGIEIWRQKVPENLCDIVQMLLDRGADKHATAHFYGSLPTTKELAETSSHSKNAGIANELALALT